jgi:putative FmdB family regulatory protein
MPIYEYRCEKCGDFERTQRITDEPLQRCPTCRRKVRRLISNTSFQLKGSGWYVTDYARAGAKNDKGESADGTAKADGSTSSDDTPAKAEASKGESSKAESSKTEASKTEASKTETSKTPRPGKSASPATKSGPAAKSGS